MLFCRDCEIGINRRPYWNYAIDRDCQIRNNRRLHWNYAIYRDYRNKINRRPYWNYAFYRDEKKTKNPGGHIEIMLFIEIYNLELTDRHIGIIYL